MFTRITGNPPRPSDSRTGVTRRRRSPFAVPVAMLASVAILLLGVPAVAVADDAVPPTDAPSIASTDAATPTSEPDPAAEPAPAPEPSAAPAPEPTPAEPVAEVPAPEPQSAAVPPGDDEAAAPVATGDPAAAATTVAARSAKAAPVTAAAAPVGQTTIRVTKGADRQSDGSVSPLAGVRFIAIDADYDDALANSPDLADEPSVAECVTDASGACDLTVADRNAGANDGYWILEAPTISAPLPAGYNPVDSYGLGYFTDPKTITQHRYHSGPVSGTASVRNVPGDAQVRPPFGVNTLGENNTIWANSYDNPGYPTLCGAQIAIVVDRSASISGGEMSSFRTAVQSFVGVDGLGPTPSTADVYSFSTTATKVTPAPVAIGSGELATAVNAATDGAGEGYTNWDAALRLVLASPVQYDLVIVLTDGDPTTFGAGTVLDANVPVRMLEEAVVSANAVKKKGGPHADLTKIIGVGVGMTPNSELNLQAISGPVLDDDYYLAANFVALRAKLREIATDACGGSLTVTKQIVDGAGTVVDDGADGWEFTADGALLDDADAAVPTLTKTTSTPGDGKVNYAVDFKAGTGDKVITVTETPQAGYELWQQGGANAVCSVGGEDRPVVAVENGFTVTVKLNEIVGCILQNQLPLIDVGIDKSYQLPDGATAVEGGMEFTYTLVVTNNGPDDATGVVVTDTLEDELEVTGPVTVTPAVLTPTVVGNQITLEGAGPFSVGEIATITVPVKLKAAPPLPSVAVGPDDPAPEPPTVDMSDVPNEACVSIAEDDTDPSNDCDDVDIPTKRINPNVYVRCVNDVPWLYYDIAVTPSVPEGPITVTFTSADGTQTDVRTVPFDAKTGRLLWPGAAVDENGIGIGYPGYRPVTAADLDSPLRFEDLVLDPTIPSYAWRDQVNPATITFQINPSQSVLAVYPQALPTCAVERLPELQIEKTASVERVDVGDDFQYTLQVTSTGLGAASPVEIFDEIPADLRVDGITTAPGPDIPYWEDCAVTGQDGDGYGGTLHCDLVGLLGVNFPTAPPITLDVHVSEATTATTISNTGEVCWQHDGDTSGEVLCDDDTVDVLVKQVVLTGQAVCIRDTPLFSYSVTPTNLTESPQILLIWWTPEAFATHDPSLHDVDAILADGASQVDVVAAADSYAPGDTIAGSQLWPGAAVDAAGNPIAWPGWTELPNGRWVLDPSAPFYNLRAAATVEIRVNPTTDVITSYPPATPNCNATPPTTPAGLASTGFSNGWIVGPAVGGITLGSLLLLGLWLRRRRLGEV